MKTLLANQTASPEFAFVDGARRRRCTRITSRRRLPTPATVDEWNLDKSLAFYKDRFADASDFTFVFVGSFDLATMKPLVERYLGALPSIRRKETWKDVGVRPPTGVIEKKVEKGIEPKSQAAIVFTGPFEYDHDAPRWRSGRWRRCCKAGCWRRFARSWAAPTASPPARASRGSPAGVLHHHPVRLRPAAHGRSDQAGLSGDRAVQERTARPRSRSATRRKRCCANSRPTASRTTTCSARLWRSIRIGEDVSERLDSTGAVQEAERRDDSTGGEDLPQREQPRPGDAVPEKK